MALSQTATLDDVKVVLTVPRHVPRRQAAEQAEIDYYRARQEFFDRTTAETWSQLVEAARRVHAEVSRRG